MEEIDIRRKCNRNERIFGRWRVFLFLLKWWIIWWDEDVCGSDCKLMNEVWYFVFLNFGEIGFNWIFVWL